MLYQFSLFTKADEVARRVNKARQNMLYDINTENSQQNTAHCSEAQSFRKLNLDPFFCEIKRRINFVWWHFWVLHALALVFVEMMGIFHYALNQCN